MTFFSLSLSLSLFLPIGGKTYTNVGSPSPLYQFASPLVYVNSQLILGTRNGVFATNPPSYQWGQVTSSSLLHSISHLSLLSLS